MKYKKIKHINAPGCAHELTFSCFRRQNFLFDETLCQWFLENLDSCRNCGMFKILSYVLMPNHVHLLIIPQNENYDIGKILSSIKIPITRKILFERHNFETDLIPKMLDNNSSKTIYHFWQRGGGYDRNLFSKEAIWASINYMHSNPVKKGLVETPENWKWSSARFYAGMDDYVLRMDNEVLGAFI
jgi:putative transposase